ncbi:hypothetical protein SISSUDRAFT_992677, partial [Sistotremastrum suecicum HHB10207 ss-3]
MPIEIDGRKDKHVYYRNVIDVVKHLFGSPKFETCMSYASEEHYSAPGYQSRLYNEMNTGKFWTRTQLKLPESSTVIPLLISTDKTVLARFGNQNAYPVYLSIGNIDKDVRKRPSSGAWCLIGFLPVGKFDDETLSNPAARKARFRLFHAAMRKILRPLIKAGTDGVDMTDPIGYVRHCYPVLAVYPCDYPEQTLVCCTRYGTTCPICDTVKTDFTKNRKGKRRKQDETLTCLRKAGGCETDKEAYEALDEHDLVFVPCPFWADFPHTNIHGVTTPDILHQLYQGMIKHVIGWLKKIVGVAELNNRFMRIPSASGLRHFASGISALANVTGSEHRDISRQLLACLHGAVDDDVLRATRALLDFTYLAQYKSHSEETLQYMQEALDLFHANKIAFFKAQGRKSRTFNFPKLHALQHYIDAIREYGTTDNYNTETTERLHIDLVKDGFAASNKKEVYNQMITWLERKEKIGLFCQHV